MIPLKHILIVDDEILIADGLRGMLAQALEGKVQVHACYASAEALRIMQERKFDVLMTDINMPDITGLELHRRIQQLQPSCRVIYLTGYSEFEYARKAIDQRAFAYVLKGEGDDTIIQTVNRALMEAKHPDEFVEASMEFQTERDDVQKPAGPAWVPELMKYIEDHIDKDLSLQQLADTMHFHPVYLSRVFKETAGTTIGDYIGTVRLERAKALLTGSRMPLQDVAEKTGFASTNYFCRWFHKETHMTPKAFRDKQ